MIAEIQAFLHAFLFDNLKQLGAHPHICSALFSRKTGTNYQLEVRVLNGSFGADCALEEKQQLVREMILQLSTIGINVRITDFDFDNGIELVGALTPVLPHGTSEIKKQLPRYPSELSDQVEYLVQSGIFGPLTYHELIPNGSRTL